MSQQTIKTITSSDLLAKTLQLKNIGYRLVAISCTSKMYPDADSPEKSKEVMELSYSFDKDYDFINLRINTDTKEEIMSISAIYSYAFLYENEIKELFGVNIKDISIDFNNNLYQIPVKTPYHAQKEEQ